MELLTKEISKLIPIATILGSKTVYSSLHPDNLVVFNARILVKGTTKYKEVWHGDLDISKSIKDLIKLSTKLKIPLYVFKESFSDKKDWVVKVDSNKVTMSKQDQVYFKFSMKGKQPIITWDPVRSYQGKPIIAEIKLPYPETFLVDVHKSDSDHPLIKMYEFVLEQQGVKTSKCLTAAKKYLSRINIHDIYLPRGYYEEWMHITRFFYRKHNLCHTARVDNTIAMEFMNFSPIIIEHDHVWVRSNCIYLGKDYLLNEAKKDE